MVFFLDDDLEQDERLLDRVYDELKTWEEFENLEAKHPYSRFYISYVFIPLSGLTASDHLNRLVREHLRYMEGVKESLTVNRETGLDDYLQIRSKDIGVSQWRPFLLMIAEMPKDTPDPILEDISKNIILFVLLQNDVYSFEKEWKADIANFLVLIQQKHSDWTLEQVLDFVHANYWIPCIQEIQNYLEKFSGDRALLNAFVNIMDGSDKWYFETNRYQSKTSPFSEFQI